jgi:hypothetical protein
LHSLEILIPVKILRFLEQSANVAFLGTRDADLVPFGHRVSGWQVGADQRTMTLLLPGDSTERVVERLQHNGELAVTLEAFPAHETYQLKGRYLRHRPAHDGDGDVVDRIRQRFAKAMKPIPYGPPQESLKAFVSSPAIAVEFEVLEVYLQTPGPGAGTRLMPPVEQ